MKNLPVEIRSLTQKETKALKKIRSTSDKVVKEGYKWHKIAIALAMAAILMYGALWTRYSLFTFVLGLGSVFSVGYAVFVPFDIHKDIRRARSVIRKVDEILNLGSIEVSPVSARQVAVAKEHEDEGDLYIVELEDNSVLYLWDKDDNFRKGFPCLQFELYNEEFARVIGRQLNPLSEKIKPVAIDDLSKWNYLRKFGSPDHRQVQKASFDKVVEKMAGQAG